MEFPTGEGSRRLPALAGAPMTHAGPVSPDDDVPVIAVAESAVARESGGVRGVGAGRSWPSFLAHPVKSKATVSSLTSAEP